MTDTIIVGKLNLKIEMPCLKVILCAAAVVQVAPTNAEQAAIIPQSTEFQTNGAVNSNGGGGFLGDLYKIFVDLGRWFLLTFILHARSESTSRVRVNEPMNWKNGPRLPPSVRLSHHCARL